MSTNDDNIKRYLPRKQCEISQYHIYPRRFTRKDFDEYERIMKDDEIRRKYDMWKSGINPNTKKKIKINGPLHRAIGRQFCIPEQINERGRKIKRIPFKKFDQIKNVDKYLEREQIMIDKTNNDVRAWNEQCAIVIKSISELKDWNDCVRFDDTSSYGLPHVLNKVHRTNNCNGKITLKWLPVGCVYVCDICCNDDTCTHRIRHHRNRGDDSDDWLRIYYTCKSCNAIIDLALAETIEEPLPSFP